MFYILILVSLFVVQIENGISQANKICPNLAQRLEKGEKLNVLVTFTKGVKSAIETTKALRHASRGARNTALKAELEKNADESQQGVTSMLSSRSSGGGYKDYIKFWIGNTMLIKEADLTTVKAIAEDSQVSKIMAEPIYRVPEIKQLTQSDQRDSPAPDPDWNMQKIQLTEAWAELNGSKGEGVIVANIDTGVRHTHGLIRHNFRGEYGWYDGVQNKTEPYDSQGHGTGCMSLLTGGAKPDNGPNIGIAPGATWMACVGCNSSGDCDYQWMARCWQFIACPTLADGSKEDCSKAPHVLSYSIAGSREPPEYLPELLALHEMGIIVVAGLGNNGPFCDTAQYPASSEHVIGVGASNYKDDVWDQGSRGPTHDGRIKPDLVAPGAWVHSAFADYIEKDPFYTFLGSGTSYATPHVAGVVALLKVRDPELTFEGAYKLLTENADRPGNITYPAINENCTEKEVTFPNNLFGWGRLNVLRAVQAQTKLLAEKGKRK